MKSLSRVIFLFSLIFVLASCSDDDDDEPNNNPTGGGGGEHGGSASFVISGEIEGEMSGVADFRAFESGGIHTWDINVLDLDPITYTIQMIQMGDEPISRPEPGTYELGINPGNQSDDIYTTTFVNFDENMNQDNYTVGTNGTSGQLIITSSSDELIEGTFEFSAVRFEDGNVAGTIEVTEGEFSAVPRQ